MPRNKAAKNSKSKNSNRKRSQKKQNKPKIGNKGHSRQKTVGIARKVNMSGKPMSFSGTRSSRHGNGLLVCGSDYVGQVNVDAASLGAGSKLLELDVCPSQFTGTRISQIAPLFERYKIRSWKFTYTPAVPSTQAGQLLFYPEYDPEDAENVDPLTRIRQGTAHMGSVLFNVYSPATINFISPDPFTDLFTDGSGDDQRLTIAGLVRLYLVTALTTPVTLGTLHMDYEIEFYIPQLQSISQITPLTTVNRLRDAFLTGPNKQIVTLLSNLSTSVPVSVDSVIEMLVKPNVLMGFGNSGATLPTTGTQTVYGRAVPDSAATSGSPAQSGGMSPYMTIFQTFSDAMKAGGDWFSSTSTGDGDPFATISTLVNKSSDTFLPNASLFDIIDAKLIPISQFTKGAARVN